MSNEQQQPQSEDVISSLSQHELHNIYRSLSINEERNFDVDEQTDKIVLLIERSFKKEFLMLPTEKLCADKDFFNKVFVALIKKNEEQSVTSVGLLFVGFCDYFNFDLNDSFNMLHDNIKNMICETCKKMVGKKRYNSFVVTQHQGFRPMTLAELIEQRKQQQNDKG